MVKASIKFNSKKDATLANVTSGLSVAVDRSLSVMERNIKLKTPIRTGTLGRSITKRMTSNVEGEIFTAPLSDGKEINYAVHVEYGTKYMAPRAMFRKGVAQSEERIKQIFNEELNKK